mmetsp:Transcript_3414/g.12029  ORF Transcript_3414/g.12029 Transcript_3414/m.12029 type:complete len:373 (+) Transcript_3414:45-1163(+)
MVPAWLLGLVGRCGAHRKHPKVPREGWDGGSSRNASVPPEPSGGGGGLLLAGGEKYVEVRASESLLIDGESLEMGREALGALRRALESARLARAEAEETRNDAVVAREMAQDSVRERYAERDTVLGEVLELGREIERVELRRSDLEVELGCERETQARLESEAAECAERRSRLEHLWSRNAELDQEVARAREVVRTEKNARVKAQAQASADAQQATEALRQRQERVQSELADADAAIRREKDEQGHLRRKAKGIALALEQCEADVADLLQARRQKMDQLHDQLISIEDSPLKAEYRRASQRLQKEREETEVLRLQAAVLREQGETQERRLLAMRAKKEGWEEEEAKLRAELEEQRTRARAVLASRSASRKLF